MDSKAKSPGRQLKDVSLECQVEDESWDLKIHVNCVHQASCVKGAFIQWLDKSLVTSSCCEVS